MASFSFINKSRSTQVNSLFFFYVPVFQGFEDPKDKWVTTPSSNAVLVTFIGSPGKNDVKMKQICRLVSEIFWKTLTFNLSTVVPTGGDECWDFLNFFLLCKSASNTGC